MKNQFETLFAKHDRAHCLAGIFRPLQKGQRKAGKLDITYRFGKDETIKFWGPEPLAADDMLVLQGLVALGGPEGLLLTSHPESDIGKFLRFDLAPEVAAAEKNSRIVKTSVGALLREIGKSDGGHNILRVIFSLKRMSAVTILAEKGKIIESYHLMSFRFDLLDGKVMVALNPRITEAILGDIPHVKIAMDEVRSLHSDHARLLHQNLSAWIDPGRSRQVTIDTLVGYLWNNESSGEFRKYKARVRKALGELVKAGWHVHEYARGKYKISRPK